MRRWTLVFASLAILAFIGMAACSSSSPALTSQPDTEPSPTAAAFVESANTSAVSTPPTQEIFPPSEGRQLLPTLSLEAVPETPLAVPTFDRAAALPTPRLPAGMHLHSEGLEIITAENVHQLELVAEIRSEDGINSNVAFSPDDRWLVAGSSTGIIHVWDVATGDEVAVLAGHTSRVRSIAFSPDGNLLASGSWDKTVILWDTATWTPIRTLLGHEHYVSQVAFSPDGTLLASGGIPLIVWDVGTGEPLYTINASGLIPEDLEFSPDGSLLASAHGETDFFLWDALDGSLVHVLVGETTTSHVAFSAEGMLAAGSSSFSAGDMNPLGQILFWDPWLGTPLGATQENAATLAMTFTVDSSLLITCGWVGNDMLFWRTTDGMRIWELTGHARTAYTLALSNDGTLLASGDLDGRILIWALPDGS